jgi:hypothetical protein
MYLLARIHEVQRDGQSGVDVETAARTCDQDPFALTQPGEQGRFAQ